jgi:hypothetical protein
MSLRLVPAIHRATHRIGLFLADLRDDSLSQGESHILALLATSGPATIAELHRGLAHKRSTLTSILDRLSDRGYVTRDEASPIGVRSGITRPPKVCRSPGACIAISRISKMRSAGV